jgi:hypothetical protein
MILYQMAKWKEQRDQLAESIQLTNGDVSGLMDEHKQLSELMTMQAARWSDWGRAAAYPIIAEAGADDSHDFMY